jgi:hypothetical protein
MSSANIEPTQGARNKFAERKVSRVIQDERWLPTHNTGSMMHPGHKYKERALGTQYNTKGRVGKVKSIPKVRFVDSLTRIFASARGGNFPIFRSRAHHFPSVCVF